MKHVRCSIILLFSVITCLHGQSIELHPFLLNQYELQNQTWGITQDPDSYLIYLANSKGLMEYNGITWEKHPLKDDVPLRSVRAHSSGIIFSGSFEDFGYWERNSRHQLVYHSLAHLTEIRRNDEIWKIYFHENEVYFQSFTTVYIYDFTTIRRVTAPYTMLFMHQVNGRFIAEILNNGLFSFHDDDFHFIENSELFSDKKIHAIIPYQDEKWLVCTDKNGIYLYDGAGFTYFASEASDFLRLNNCNAAKQLNDSTYAFGTILNGLIITDHLGRIQDAYNTRNGLNNNTVLSLFEDADGGLWIGLDVGINYLNLKSPFTHYHSPDGTLGTIYTLFKDGNHLYIGTNHGLFKSEVIRRAQTYYFTDIRMIPDSYGQVWTIEKFDGQIICGHNDGTFLLRNDRLHRISYVTGGWTYRRFGDYLLAGTYTGLIVFEKNQAGEWQFRNRVSDFTEPTRYLEIDYLGYVWASHHQKGIYQIELSDDLYYAKNVRHFPGINDRSYNIKAFKINNRVVFSTSEDVYTFDFVRNGIIRFQTLSDNLLDFKASSHILKYRNNQYWFITANKIALFQIDIDFSARRVFEIFHENIQLPQRSIQLAALDDNTVIIPNPKSFDAYNIALGEASQDISRLRIEKMLFFGGKDSTLITSPASGRDTPWKRNSITVYFADPSGFDQTNRNYQYRIKELDPSWQTTSANHFSYIDIRHGDYTIEIRRDPEKHIELAFTVRKPWFATHMAIIAYILLFMIIVWSLILFFRFEVRRHKELVSLELRQSTLQSELDYKSHELMLTMRHLIMKDEILNDIQRQITAIREQSSKYPVKYINNMERIVKRGLGFSSDEWENAIQNLKLSQQGFFKYLKDKYPDLTPNDLRLCSFLRLNFNTKEIAQLLNISTRGVETSRHRLRKKMKLGKKQNLTEFLINLDWEDDHTD